MPKSGEDIGFCIQGCVGFYYCSIAGEKTCLLGFIRGRESKWVRMCSFIPRSSPFSNPVSPEAGVFISLAFSVHSL